MSGPPAMARLLFDAALKSDFLFWAAPRVAPRALLPALIGTPAAVVASADTQERSRVALVLDHLMPFSQRRLGILNDGRTTPFLPRYELESIGVPTLILGTVDDLYGTWEGARYTAEHIPHARLIEYPTGGHAMVGHREEALSEIAAFLQHEVAVGSDR